MPVLDRYIFRLTTVAFLGSLAVLTGVVWITQALREFDIVTTQGQTIWTFLIVTGLALPSLALIVMPIALFGAIIWALNKLNADSELAVMAGSGVTPIRLMRPLLLLSVIVAIMVGILSSTAIPASLRELREIVTQIRADVVVNILREGGFNSMGNGLTVHIRERTPQGSLLGIFVYDERDKTENNTYIAQRGRVLENESGTFLVLEDGMVQRHDTKSNNVPMVAFERYAFDLSPLTGSGEDVTYKPRERYTADLWKPDPDDSFYKMAPGRFRSELHDRLSSPLYPIAFMFLAFAVMGRARTTRQTRTLGVLTAIGIAFVVRLLGYAATNMAGSSAAAIPLIYAVPIGAIIVSTIFMFRGRWTARAVPRTGQPVTVP